MIKVQKDPADCKKNIVCKISYNDFNVFLMLNKHVDN